MSSLRDYVNLTSISYNAKEKDTHAISTLFLILLSASTFI